MVRKHTDHRTHMLAFPKLLPQIWKRPQRERPIQAAALRFLLTRGKGTCFSIKQALYMYGLPRLGWKSLSGLDN